jgi:hypothetical protein
MELFLNAEIPEEPQNTIEGGVGLQHYPDLTDAEIKRIMTAIEMEDNETLTNSFAGGGESYESLLDFTYHPIEEEKKEEDDEDDEDDNSDTSSFSIFNIRDTQDWDENDFTGGKFSYKNKKRTKRNNKKKNKNKTKRNNKNKNKTKRNNKKKNRTKRKVKR